MFNPLKQNKDTGNDSNNSLEKEIESLLFYKGEEVSLSVLQKTLARKKTDIKEAIKNLKDRLNKDSALTILENEEKYLLTVNYQYSSLINDIKAEEQFGELSSPALETLAIILYKGPLSKIQIDQIRGVNSSYILRNLLIRGLVERRNQDGKTVYIKTLDLMRYLGITEQTELPAYKKVVTTLNKIETEEDLENTEKTTDTPVSEQENNEIKND